MFIFTGEASQKEANANLGKCSRKIITTEFATYSTLGTHAKFVDENGAPVYLGHSLHLEPQFARCISNRYRSGEFPRCVSCTRRWAGDPCRFQGIRFFLKDENHNIVGISFIENEKADGPPMKFPVKWNVKLELSHIGRIKVSKLSLVIVLILTFLEAHCRQDPVARAQGGRAAPPTT